MQKYVCQHCHRDLGAVVDGTPPPECPDHPQGIVEIVEEPDAPLDS